MPTQTEIFVSILLFPRLFDLNRNRSNYITEMTFSWINTLINWSIYILIYTPEPTDLRCYLPTHQPLLPIELPTSSSSRQPTHPPPYRYPLLPVYLPTVLSRFSSPNLPTYASTFLHTNLASYSSNFLPPPPAFILCYWTTFLPILPLIYLPTFTPATSLPTYLPTSSNYLLTEWHCYLPTYLQTFFRCFPCAI